MTSLNNIATAEISVELPRGVYARFEGKLVIGARAEDVTIALTLLRLTLDELSAEYEKLVSAA